MLQSLFVCKTHESVTANIPNHISHVAYNDALHTHVLDIIDRQEKKE